MKKFLKVLKVISIGVAVIIGVLLFVDGMAFLGNSEFIFRPVKNCKIVNDIIQDSTFVVDTSSYDLREFVDKHQRYRTWFS